MAKGVPKPEGKLRIGDQWNAIRIIALSQSNPLKAIAEFVENSIDAHATHITVTRGKQRGEQYLSITDDGQGVHDFQYVATHIGDSIKRKLKRQGASGIQGEFGIGLLSFWTVGETLTLTSRDSGGAVRRLKLAKESPAYQIRDSRELFDRPGTTLQISPILQGVRTLSGERIRSYLASELRDRITRSGVTIQVVDKAARKRLEVTPHHYRGVPIHDLPLLTTPFGEVRTELYINDPSAAAGVSLVRSGTRVLERLADVHGLDGGIWTNTRLEGAVEADFLNLTPGTRSGIVHDERAAELVRVLRTIAPTLLERITEQQRAEEEEASRSLVKRVTRALREALLRLPEEQYAWLASQVASRKSASSPGGRGEGIAETGDIPVGATAIESSAPDPERGERALFDYPGPLHRVDILPGKSTINVGAERALTARLRDRSGRAVSADNVEFEWSVAEGAGDLAPSGEFASYAAPPEPELARVHVVASQLHSSGDRIVEADAHITVTAELLDEPARSPTGRGLPGYTLLYRPGELWRSTYSETDALITVNSGHPDFVHAASRPKAKLRYVAHLYVKELVLANFPGAEPNILLERFVELITYMNEAL